MKLFCQALYVSNPVYLYSTTKVLYSKIDIMKDKVLNIILPLPNVFFFFFCHSNQIEHCVEIVFLISSCSPSKPAGTFTKKHDAGLTIPILKGACVFVFLFCFTCLLCVHLQAMCTHVVLMY